MTESATRMDVSTAADAANDDAWLPGPGVIIAARYKVDRVIGRGGMGAVVAAEHTGLGDRVAIKFLHPRLAKDKENLDRFMREARATARIKSDHVVRIIDVGTTSGGLPYIVMELLDGCDLGQLLTDRGPLDFALAIDCTLQAAEALAEAHAEGIVHRDIKPSNLWVTARRDGTLHLRVLDFGISKLIPVVGREGADLTDTQAVFGSPMYMSPEQIRSAKRVDHRTDVWALGVVLYELLTGRLPFDADNVAGILAAIIGDAPGDTRALRPDLPVPIQAVLLSSLEKDPARRASLVDFATGLKPFASPLGRIAATRIEASAKPEVSILPTPRPSMSDALLALGKTEPSVVTTMPTWRRSAGVVAAIGAGACVTLAVVGIVGVRLATQRTHAAAETPATSMPSAPPPAEPPVVLAFPAPPPEVVPADSTTSPPIKPVPVVSATKPAKPASPARPTPPKPGPPPAVSISEGRQ